MSAGKRESGFVRRARRTKNTWKFASVRPRNLSDISNVDRADGLGLLKNSHQDGDSFREVTVRASDLPARYI